jgi:D-inositol-3-phosphate glycosyltransferase
VRPLNLAFVCFSNAWGGLEMKFVEIAASLRSRGHAIVVVSPRQSPMINECMKIGIPTREFTPHAKYLDILTAMKLKNLYQEFAIDVVTIGRSSDISTCLLGLKLAGRGKLVFFQQMQFGIEKKDIFHRWVYGNLDRWITLTHNMKDSVIRNTVVGPERVMVIPSGSDLTRFDPALYDSTAARRKFNLPLDKFIFAVIGRLDRQKGQEFAIRALATILPKQPHAYLILVGEETVGETGYKRELESLAGASGVQQSFRFLPYTREVPELLSAVDLLLLPSLGETFGYVVVEAMAMGKPVIGTRAGGVSEIIDDGTTGFLVEPANAEELAEKISLLMEHRETYRQIAVSARINALQRFDVLVQIEKLEKIYRGVLQ